MQDRNEGRRGYDEGEVPTAKREEETRHWRSSTGVSGTGSETGEVRVSSHLMFTRS